MVQLSFVGKVAFLVALLPPTRGAEDESWCLQQWERFAIQLASYLAFWLFLTFYLFEGLNWEVVDRLSIVDVFERQISLRSLGSISALGTALGGS